jgi:hypothetical protein
MIRRGFPALITSDIVNVQPMSGPVGLAFALRCRYAPKVRHAKHINQRTTRRNTMPIETFLATNQIVISSKHFYDIVCEMAANRL